MGKKLGALAALLLAAACCLAFGGCNSNPPVDNTHFLGAWELESGSASGLAAGDVTELRKFGSTATLELNDDGTGQLALFGTDPVKATWTASTDTSGNISFGDDKATIALASGKLTLTNTRNEVLTFVRPGAAASASAQTSGKSTGSASAAAAPDEATGGETPENPDDPSAESANAEPTTTETIEMQPE